MFLTRASRLYAKTIQVFNGNMKIIMLIKSDCIILVRLRQMSPKLARTPHVGLHPPKAERDCRPFIQDGGCHYKNSTTTIHIILFNLLNVLSPNGN